MDQDRIQGLRERLELKEMWRLSFYVTSKAGRDQEKHYL